MRVCSISFELDDVLMSLLRRDRTKDNVHLLQTTAFGLRDEIGEATHKTDVNRRKHQEDFVPEARDHHRSSLGHDEICPESGD